MIQVSVDPLEWKSGRKALLLDCHGLVASIAAVVVDGFAGVFVPVFLSIISGVLYLALLSRCF